MTQHISLQVIGHIPVAVFCLTDGILIISSFTELNREGVADMAL